MLRYDRQTKPGLVALYDIRPGNGAGLFLQPRSQCRADDDDDDWLWRLWPWLSLVSVVTDASAS